MKKISTLSIVCFLIFCILNPSFAQLKEYGSQNVNKCVFANSNNPGSAIPAITIPNNSLVQDGIYGIEMWVYIPTGGLENVYRNLFAIKGYSFQLYQMPLHGHTLAFNINTAYAYNSDGIELTENVWTHIAVTWLNIDATYYHILFYVNGQQSGSAIDKWVAPAYNANPVEVGIADGYYSPGYYVDEVRFWTSPPGQTEIAASRFVGIGDGAGANTGMSMTNASSVYKNLLSSYTVNYQDGNNAYDDIGGYTGVIGSTSVVQNTYPGQPIPYNLALQMPYRIKGYVSVPSDALFNNVTTSGTIEAWVHPTTTAFTGTIMQKSADAVTSSYSFAIKNSKLRFYIGGGVAISNGEVPLNKWSHVAVSWSKFGSNYDIDFYLNGKNIGSALLGATMSTSSSDLWIGNSQVYEGEPALFTGYLDEVRLWSSSRPPDSIRAYMFSSCRNINNPRLLAAYNFDGNLLNYSRYSLPGGTFSLTGSDPNLCRFSGYLNESTTGAINNSFVAYPTTMNYGSEDNYFNKKFRINTPNLTIPVYSTVNDSILISGFPGSVYAVEVMVNLHHLYIGGIGITVTAPNGVSKVIFNHSGGGGKHLFTVFNDNYALTTSTLNYLPPYTPSVKPDNLMGDFGGSPINGYWKISVNDVSGGEVGTLLGWGLKINDIDVGLHEGNNSISSTAIPSQNYPNPFNSSTTIKFHLPAEDFVSLKIYTVFGNEITTLIHENLKAGDHEVKWDVVDLTSGVYYYCIETKSAKASNKMILIK